MKTALANVSDPVGFHLRAAGRIVRVTKRFQCEVIIRYQGKTANAKSIMGLASLDAEYGAEVQIECDGRDENEALDSLIHLIGVELAKPEAGA